MSTRIYVGNLPLDVREREVDDLFYKYGRIRDIDLKTPARPPAFAFVTFDDPRDADDAIRGRDGYNFAGGRLRVELSKGGRDDRDRGDRGDRGARGGDRGGDRGGRGGRGPPRRSDYGVIVSGLPRSCSWQDLKDHMRKAGDVIYADVDGRGEGRVEYSNREDMEEAVRRLDDTEFKNPFDQGFIRVRFQSGGGERADSRDRGSAASARGAGEERGRDPSRSRSRDRKRSISRSRDRDAERPRAGSRDRDHDDEDRPPRRDSIDEPRAAPRGEEDA